jgi:hypothetical protein
MKPETTPRARACVVRVRRRSSPNDDMNLCGSVSNLSGSQISATAMGQLPHDNNLHSLGNIF